MTYLSIMDKLIVLFNLLKESGFVLIFLGILLLSVILRMLKKIGNSRFFIMVVLSLFGAFLTVLFINYDILSRTFDKFLDILFTNIYFPSIYVYLFLIFSTYVVVIVTLLNKKIDYISRIINYIMSVLLNLILILNLNIVAKDRVDIFSVSSMYTNINLVSMLELSVNIYILWMLIISFIFIVNHVTENILIKRESRKLLTSPVEMGMGSAVVDSTLVEEKESVEDPVVSSVVGDASSVIFACEDNSLEVEDLISSVTLNELKHEEVSSVKNKFIDNSLVDEIKESEVGNDSFTFNQCVENSSVNFKASDMNPILTQILNNTFPIQKEEVKVVEKFTLNDYKLFSNMLKEAIKLNNSTILNIGDMLNINLLNKFSYEEYSLFKKMLNSYTN